MYELFLNIEYLCFDFLKVFSKNYFVLRGREAEGKQAPHATGASIRPKQADIFQCEPLIKYFPKQNIKVSNKKSISNNSKRKKTN